MSIYKIELDTNLEIIHMSATYHDEAPIPEVGLIVDEKYSELFGYFMGKVDLLRAGYSFDSNKFNKKSSAELNNAIIDYVDKTTITPKAKYSELGYIEPSKDIDSMTPEELNEIVEPIPTIEDFPDIPDDFIKENLYTKGI